MRRLAFIAALAASGCSLAPRYERPTPPVPLSWPVGDAYLRQSEAALPSVSYRDVFRDTRLQQLIEQALLNNRDLRAAAANIRTARAQYRIQRADRFPNLAATASARASDGGSSSFTTLPGTGVGSGGTTPGTGTNPGSGTGTTPGTGTGTGNNGGGSTVATGGGGFSDSYQVGVGVTAFELDLFGRVASLTRAAQDEYFATEAAARATRLALVGDIADAWLTYAADRSLLTIAEDTAQSAEQSVRLTRLRLEGGIAPRTDLRQAELVLRQAQSDLAEQRTALAQDANLIQLLVGAPIDPATLPGPIDTVAATLTELPAGLDSGVLLRRPDVVQAEYSLRAANARIGAARALLFPRISLTGLVSFASGALGSLFNGDSFGWNASGAASYDIFNAGAGRAGVEQTRAQRDFALATYERTIQTAFREVSDALARRGTIAEQEQAQLNLVAAAQDNYNLATQRYRGGIDTFLQSLDAQRSFYQAQQSLTATRLIRAQNLVALYRTLGGDALLDATGNGPRPLSPEPPSPPAR